MENFNIDSQLQNTLLKFTSSLFQISQGAIVLKEIYNKMMLGHLDKKILTGFKLRHLISGLTFDVITEIDEMDHLPDMDEKMVPIIHSFNYPEIKKPQMHLLALNKQFPKITKAFLCLPGDRPLMRRLITNHLRYKMFITGSYILLDEFDYYIISN